MPITKIIATLILFTLASCGVDKHIFQKEKFDELQLLKISTVTKLENRVHSRDITPNHLIGIGAGIYPNKKKLILETPKTYITKEQPNFQLETQYFYSANDSLVKVILYQWDYLEKKDVDFPEAENLTNKFKAFQIKFNRLKDKLTKTLGQPIEINIEQNRTSDSAFRDGIKWKNNSGLKAYLFMFGNNNGYRQIRLAVYKD